MSTVTSANHFEFDPEVKRRLGPILHSPPKNVSAKDDPLDPELIRIRQEFGKVQAVAIPGTKKPGYSEVYRHVNTADGIISTYHPEITTVYEAVQRTIDTYPQRDALGERVWDEKSKQWSKDYEFQTFAEISDRRDNLGAGIVHVVNKHVGLTSEDRKYIVAVYGPNTRNWVVTDLACISQSLPSVCLYDTLGPTTSEYILNFCESPIAFVSLANIPAILKLKPKLPNLKIIVSLDPLRAKLDHEAVGQSKCEILSAWSEDLGVALYEFKDIEEIGKKHPRARRPPKVDDIYAINFTSGTTGNPKGAILTHSNIVSSLAFTHGSVTFTKEQQTFFSMLPLAHIYERCTLVNSLSIGVRVGFPHGPLTEILDDIAVLRPHGTCMVPRVLNRIASTLKTLTLDAPGFAGYVSRKAYAAKLAHLEKTGSVRHPVWDRLWCNKIRKAIGFENVQTVMSGSAPLSKDTHQFLRLALAIDLCQGYGLTETMSGISVSQPNDPDTGSCGPVGLTCEIRLRDVPDLGYSSDDKPEPRGEIMLRGPQIFRGYYKNNEKTLEAFDEDGWFHTGDVGKLDSFGRIHIIDRVKNFFKLAQGEYIGAEKIENVYTSRSALLAQIFIHGDSTETYLVAVVGVNPELYAPWVSKLLGKNIAATDLQSLAETYNNKKVRNAFLVNINKPVEAGVLQGFERVKNVILALEPLSMENDTITPTLKVKRNVAAKVFKEEIAAMYKEGAQPIKAEDVAKL